MFLDCDRLSLMLNGLISMSIKGVRLRIGNTYSIFGDTFLNRRLCED
jgi:hypothetical protein